MTKDLIHFFVVVVNIYNSEWGVCVDRGDDSFAGINPPVINVFTKFHPSDGN